MLFNIFLFLIKIDIIWILFMALLAVLVGLTSSDFKYGYKLTNNNEKLIGC